MCTLNGERYLEEQLQSFAAQSHRDWSLWVSDDGSEDGSLAVVERFRAAHPSNEVRLFNGPGQGLFSNYMSLIQHVTEDPATLYAFSDQDDVWQEDKLKRAAVALADTRNVPAAYATAQILTDHRLAGGGLSRPCPRPPSFQNALVQNILSGNTLVVNSVALGWLKRNRPASCLPFHDWWIYQALSGMGARLKYDNRPSILYRQHGTNTLGGNTGLFASARRAVLLGGSEYQDWINRNLEALVSVSSDFTPENQDILRRFVASRRENAWARSRAFTQLGLHRQSPAQTGALKVAAFLGLL